MNKISIYVLLILIYLGVSKSFSPFETRTPFIANEKVFDGFFSGAPLSVILLDSSSSGFLIKTYHHHYKLVYAFRPPERLTVRVSKDFWNQNIDNHGLSIFRRKDNSGGSSTIPMPPGMLFLGDPSYGNWETSDSGQRVWKFHRTYRTFKNMLGWGDFIPSYGFFQKASAHLANGKAFTGENDEFGESKSLTFKQKIQQNVLPTFKENAREYLKTFIWIPSWDSRKIKN